MTPNPDSWPVTPRDAVRYKRQFDAWLLELTHVAGQSPSRHPRVVAGDMLRWPSSWPGPDALQTYMTSSQPGVMDIPAPPGSERWGSFSYENLAREILAGTAVDTGWDRTPAGRGTQRDVGLAMMLVAAARGSLTARMTLMVLDLFGVRSSDMLETPMVHAYYAITCRAQLPVSVVDSMHLTSHVMTMMTDVIYSVASPSPQTTVMRFATIGELFDALLMYDPTDAGNVLRRIPLVDIFLDPDISRWPSVVHAQFLEYCGVNYGYAELPPVLDFYAATANHRRGAAARSAAAVDTDGDVAMGGGDDCRAGSNAFCDHRRRQRGSQDGS